jgi:hypothetical protein
MHVSGCVLHSLNFDGLEGDQVWCIYVDLKDIQVLLLQSRDQLFRFLEELGIWKGQPPNSYASSGEQS